MRLCVLGSTRDMPPSVLPSGAAPPSGHHQLVQAAHRKDGATVATGSSTLRSSIPPNTRSVGGLRAAAAAAAARGSHIAGSHTTRNHLAKRAVAAGPAIVTSVETLQPVAAAATAAGAQIPQTAQAVVTVNWSGKSERLEGKHWCGRSVATFIPIKICCSALQNGVSAGCGGHNSPSPQTEGSDASGRAARTVSLPPVFMHSL